jgi:hypothetical protein
MLFFGCVALVVALVAALVVALVVALVGIVGVVGVVVAAAAAVVLRIEWLTTVLGSTQVVADVVALM